MGRHASFWTAALVFALLAESGGAAAQPTVRIGTAVPSWVEPIEVPASVPENDSAVEDLLYDQQWQIQGPRASRFVHLAYRIRSTAGLEQASELSVDVGPDETLEWHYVRRQRDGRSSEVLEPSAVRLIQPEEALAMRIYDEGRRALVFLEDVRVGDTIEYAFTVVQSYEVFAGRFAIRHVLSGRFPVRHVHFRASWPTSRPIQSLATQMPTTWIRERADGRIVIDARDVGAARIPTDAPSWHEPFAAIELSEHASWAAVAEWGAALYEELAAEPLPSSIPLSSFASAADPLERVARALRFVQDEVRYLGLEIGAHAFRPHSLDDVSRRRYGDCKDKALLLVAILRALGIEAHPALVNPYLREAVARRLPSPQAFNHVIVRAEVGSDVLWLDPTRTHQRGPVLSLPSLTVGRALILRAGETDLVLVPSRAPLDPTHDVEERFVIAGSGAELEIVHVYRGDAAAERRSELDIDERQRLEIAGYAQEELELEVRAPMEIEDDLERDELRVRSQYWVSRFWRDGARDVSPWLVLEQLSEPRRGRPDAPFALAFPTHVRHLVSVENGNGWDIPPSDQTLTAGPLSVSHRVRVDGARLTIDTRARNDTDHVAADGVDEYRTALAQIARTASFAVTRESDDGAGQGASERSGTVVALLCIGAPFLLLSGAFGVHVVASLWSSRRRRAFRRKQRARDGDDPTRAIEVDSLESAKERHAIRCCGIAFSAGAWSTARLGERRLAVCATVCTSCGTRHRRFYRVQDDDPACP